LGVAAADETPNAPPGTSAAANPAVNKPSVAEPSRAVAPVSGIPTAIWDYTQRPDATFAWSIRERTKIGDTAVLQVDLTSQKWQGIVWRHALSIFEPADLAYPNHVLLFVTGGSTGKPPRQDSLLIGAQLARLTKSRVAMLHQVPNQPLFGGRHEDDLITDTWLRYLNSGDAEWPLLFPMVKSAVRAMDAIEAIAAKEWKTPIKGFVITGASKRGWTSWLTPVADRRVIATAPMVIDMLNMRPQMDYQLATWGAYSEQIQDYTSKNLVTPNGKETPRESQLRAMMDPYTYRQILTLPKLIIHGTNDRYWTVDAMTLYWDGLVGPKYTIALPNAGHNLRGGQELVASTLAAFFRHVVSGQPMPSLDWKFANGGDAVTLKVTSSPRPKAARIWRAESASKDFRESKWSAQPMAVEGADAVAKVEKPKDRHIAVYGELQFEVEGLPYSLTTLVQRF
jgi:PhoPQ-activated pathogenicity-related protein